VGKVTKIFWLENDVKKFNIARRRWLMAVILNTQEAKIRRIEVLSQPMQIVYRHYLKKTFTEEGWWSGLKVKALSSSPGTPPCKKKRKKNLTLYDILF
jgi:hypothetical protein